MCFKCVKVSHPFTDSFVLLVSNKSALAANNNPTLVNKPILTLKKGATLKEGNGLKATMNGR